MVDGNKPELIADIDAAADYSQGEHHADNGNRDFEIAFVVVHKKLFECSFFFLFHKAAHFQQYTAYCITFRVKKLYQSHNFIVSLFLAVYTKRAKYKTLEFEILLHGGGKFFQRMISY